MSTALVDAALSHVRAEALEEAAVLCETAKASRGGYGTLANGDVFAGRIRALSGTTPPASIPVERVREVLAESGALEPLSTPPLYLDGWNAALEDVGRRLGVPIDGAQEQDRRQTCLACRMPTLPSEHTCGVLP